MLLIGFAFGAFLERAAAGGALSGLVIKIHGPYLDQPGVSLTGADTSSNALFRSLQNTTAHQIGDPDTLLVAANTTGGVTAKMISPQSIAVACAAAGLAGKESDLFRFTLRHSLLFAVIIGIITMLQAYVFTGMIAH
ncbi:L-lactate permease [Janthinobacterium sp. GB4P2]|uniref:L-lactate permease n=1 Tax=Janthinobacterium sp. GB4P2 TaxID=3424189 RepID=UPI003F26747F